LGEFRPRIGRTDRARDRVASSSVPIAKLVRRGHGRLRAHAGARLPPTAGFGPRHTARRVIVKAHLHRLGRRGAQAAARHLRYIERDGVEKDGSAGVLYGREGPVPRERFEEPRLGERHQFRFIVSPEDARKLDLTDYIRELMARVERDIGRSIEWAAVNHHDTDHPHAHVIIRGVCREGQSLRMDRAYIARGLRWSAQELATERLGPRLAVEIQRTREREVMQERFTSLDRELEHAAIGRKVDGRSLGQRPHGPEPALLVRRLERLETLGLADKVTPTAWVLAEDWQGQLRELGVRGDILKQMHRALDGGDPARLFVVRPGQGLPDGQGGVDERARVGRVVRKGLADELKGRAFFAVIETPRGNAFHVTVSARVAESLRVGDLVSFGTTRERAVQPFDRHLVEVAAAHRGVYALAGDHDPTRGTRTALYRLRELERLGLVATRAPGQWEVPADLIARLEAGHRDAPARYRLSLEALPLSLDAQVVRQGPVWLDAIDTRSLATSGFGAEVRAAVARRRHALSELGIAPGDPQREAKIQDLQRGAVGREIARRTGEAFVENIPARFRGRPQSGPEGAGYLAVSDGARFVLVPATPEAIALQGKTVDVAGDALGRFVGLRARGLDRER
jgi:type IV secretory pathway VirD2 relaxase